MGQLRALMREADANGHGTTLRMMFTDFDGLSRLLREPATMIFRATGRDRLRAIQRFIQTVGPMLDRDPAADLTALDARLPARRRNGWHTAGVDAGADTRCRRSPLHGTSRYTAWEYIEPK